MSINSPTSALEHIRAMCVAQAALGISFDPATFRQDVASAVEQGLAAPTEPQPDYAFAARQHLQTVETQATAYAALELAARAVCRVVKEGDPAELPGAVANLEKLVRRAGLETELAKRGTSPSGADALAYAAAAVQVDMGIKPLSVMDVWREQQGTHAERIARMESALQEIKRAASVPNPSAVAWSVITDLADAGLR